VSKLVSIIVNCYNGEKYLSDCLVSVLKQTYKNWEVIFWDNQSTDLSKKILLDFNENKFRYFKSSKFTNLSTARNLAIAQSKGDYIAFLDVDDFWLENKLEKQVNFLEKNKASLIYSNYFVYDESCSKKKIFYDKAFPEKNLFKELLKNWHVGLLTIFYNKKTVKNIFFNEKYHFIGDLDFVINNSKECKVLGQNEVLATMRSHEGNETKKKFIKHTFELLDWYRVHKKIFPSEENIKYIRNMACYNLSRILIKKKRYRRVFKLFFFLEVGYKIRVTLIFFKNLFFKTI